MDVGAIVLAGGAGSRMRPLTDACPKPLLPLGAEPLIGYQLRRLARVGVGRVVVATGYLAAQFDGALGDGARWGLRLSYSVESTPLGTGGAIRAAADLVPDVDRVIVVNGDLLSSHDLAAQVAAASDAAVLMHVRPVPEIAAYGQVRCDRQERVISFAEKAGTGPGLANAGTYVVGASVLRSIPPGPSSWERDALPRLIQRGALVRTWQADGYFRDVGDPTAYREACVDAVAGRLPGTRAYDDGLYVAPGASVAPDATLRDGCSVQPGAVVGDRAQLRATVVLPGARVGGGAQLTRCVVTAGSVVPSGASLCDEVVVAR